MKLPIVIPTCEYKGCTEPGTELARGREWFDQPWHSQPGHKEVGFFCEKHAKIVVEEGNPEYPAVCPNCRCKFGVN